MISGRRATERLWDAVRRCCLALVPAAMLMLTLDGCFTGVEGTPTIREPEVKRRKAVTTDEDRLLADVQPQPFAQWQPGKRFLVTDNKIALIFTPSSTGTEDLAGSDIAYTGCESIISVTGEETAQLSFTNDTGARLLYRINMSPAQLAMRDKIDVPFTIERSIVDEADSLLRGRRLYITTSRWLDPATLNPIANNRRHIPVAIDSVVPGNDIYPLRVVFSAAGDTDSVSTTAALLLTTDPQRAHSRGFAAFFSLTDPQLRYPQITRETWQHIRTSTVAEGMTRDECRLALGVPSNIIRNDNNAGAFEQWLYENGSYLIFQDNILIRHRQ